LAVFAAGREKKSFAFSVAESSAFIAEVQNRLVSGTEELLWSGL